MSIIIVVLLYNYVTDGPAFEELVKLINKKEKDLVKMSPKGQTSICEAWHAFLLWFCPKHIHYSYNGQLARYTFSNYNNMCVLCMLHYILFYTRSPYSLNYRLQICALHFNENADRDTRKDQHGNDQYNYSFRKYKGGSPTVKSLKVANTYSK